MERKYILLIEDENQVCYRGEGTADQIKKDITKLIAKKVNPGNLSVIPVVGSRTNYGLTLVATLGISLISWIAYESLYKRVRKRQGKHSNS